ncbi:hypothetical protein, partial [Salmonella enterica]|uniref:hypothetical protein n=1 Tax=Salmonella enterica TaxID=28901 RepID=UPI0039E82172
HGTVIFKQQKTWTQSCRLSSPEQREAAMDIPQVMGPSDQYLPIEVNLLLELLKFLTMFNVLCV